MSPSHVFEPTYAEIKRRIVHGVWLPGARLEANRIAADLGVSMTPVRDSLNRLVGERLVELEYGHGFCVARLTEQGLRDLLALNLALLLSACLVRATPARATPSESPDGDFAERTGRLFAGLAASSGNPEIVATVGWLNDRLHTVRRHDESVLVDPDIELDEIAVSTTGSSLKMAASLIAYHDSRTRVVACYLRRIERGLT